jgi:hypothetical protein
MQLTLQLTEYSRITKRLCTRDGLLLNSNFELTNALRIITNVAHRARLTSPFPP